MADEQTPTTGNQPTNDGQAPTKTDAGQSTQAPAELVAQLKEAQAQAINAAQKLEEANSAREKAMQDARTLQLANQDLHSQLTQAKTELAANKSSLDQTSAGKVNLETQVSELTQQLDEAASELATLRQSATVFNTIAEDVSLHPFIGQYAYLKGIIRPDASADDVKAALLGMGAQNTTQAQNLAQTFNKGAPPAMPPNAPAGGGKNGLGEASSKEEAFAKYKAAQAAGNRAEADHWLNQMYSVTGGEDFKPETRGAR